MRLRLLFWAGAVAMVVSSGGIRERNKTFLLIDVETPSRSRFDSSEHVRKAFDVLVDDER